MRDKRRSVLNLHVYPSPMTHESRIFREAKFIGERGGFSSVHLVGVLEDGLEPEEALTRSVTIFRLRRDFLPVSLRMLARVANNFLWYAAVYRRYRKQRVALINCHSLPVLFLCYWLSRATGAKLIYDTHELETATVGLTGSRRWMSKVIERLYIGRVDYVICVGERIRGWYVQQYRIANASVVLNCPEPPAEAAESRVDLRERFAIPTTAPVFLYQGLLSAGRGIELMLETFREVPEAHLVLLGDGPLVLLAEDAAERLANVHYHEPVPPREVLHMTRDADCGLSIIEPLALSYEYCMPNKLFEYVAAGIPVIVSNTAEQAEFVRLHDLGVVLEHFVPRDLAAAVRALDCAERERLSANAEAVRADYSWARQEPRLDRILRAVMGAS